MRKVFQVCKVIQIIPHLKIFLATEPVDFRNGIDGLKYLCKSILKQDPLSGSMFLFINKRKTAIKILVYDGQGFWLCLKRLSHGKIKFWPKNTESACSSLKACELQVLLYNGNPQNINTQPEWKKVSGI